MVAHKLQSCFAYVLPRDIYRAAKAQMSLQSRNKFMHVTRAYTSDSCKQSVRQSSQATKQSLHASIQD